MSPGRQLGFIWGITALALVALSPLAPRLASALPACHFKSLVGIPCPTCGTTRSALALSRFDFLEALVQFPLATLAWIFLIGGGGIALGMAVLGKEVPDPTRRVGPLMRWLILAAILLNWIYLILTGA